MACLLLGLFTVDAREVLLGPRAYKMCYGIAVLSAPLLLQPHHSHVGLKCGNSGRNNGGGESRYLATSVSLHHSFGVMADMTGIVKGKKSTACLF